ncbi:phage terminase small subunit [Agrobacterium larrymoorei]|uniref:Phage terminase small subunit n=1 Tax=Agrobacterium larrymoorei TaxID=160699 RepID=A0AAJ2BBL3_9HYPH|nr:terminase small subunit [Agrobacterium larrymoorei]MDR6103291.1 phage terminase small subunit [Agrobacterium larrymoorei]
MKTPRPLNPRQRLFVEEYLVDLNASQAAIRAGYSCKTAKVLGSILLKKVQVMEAVEQAKRERSERTQIHADWLLSRLAEEAVADIADLYDENGGLKPVDQWPLIWRQGLVAAVEVKELFEGRGESREAIGRVSQVKLSDRIKRLELIGKHIDVQAFREKVEVEVSGSLAERLARAKARVLE